MHEVMNDNENATGKASKVTGTHLFAQFQRLRDEQTNKPTDRQDLLQIQGRMYKFLEEDTS